MSLFTNRIDWQSPNRDALDRMMASHSATDITIAYDVMRAQSKQQQQSPVLPTSVDIRSDINQRLNTIRARLFNSALPETEKQTHLSRSSAASTPFTTSQSSSPLRSLSRALIPECPCTLRLVSATSSSVVLVWEKPVGGARNRYKVFRDDSGTGIVNSPSTVVYDGWSTMLVDTNLKEQKQYAYLLAVLVDDEWSQLSSPLYVTTPSGTWQGEESGAAPSPTRSPTFADRFRASSSSSPFRPLLSEASETSEESDSLLVSITSRQSAAFVDKSLIPTPLAPTFRCPIGGNVMVLWEGGEGSHFITEYRLYRSNANSFGVQEDQALLVYSGPATLFHDSGLRTGARYAYAVQAVVNGNTSRLSPPSLYTCPQ